MESAPKSVKYHVQVVRLRFDTVIIEVDATDDEEAEQKAIEHAQLISDGDWQLQPFDHDAYRPYAETMVAEDELMESEKVEDALALNETRYLLLKGDCEGGQGDIVLQPWFNTDQPDLLTSDLCKDWIGTLEQLGLTHLSDRLDSLAAGEPPTPSDRILFGTPSPKRQDR